MNVLVGISKARGYDALFQESIAINNDFQEKTRDITNRINEHMEKICKTQKYIDFIMKVFESDSFDVFLSIYQMNIMIQALNKRDMNIATDDNSGENCSYSYDGELYPQFREYEETIMDVFQDDLGNNPISECMNFYLYTSSNPKARNRYLTVTNSDFEYLDDYEFQEFWFVEDKYEKAIRAVNQLYIDNADRILKIMEKNLDN